MPAQLHSVLLALCAQIAVQHSGGHPSWCSKTSGLLLRNLHEVGIFKKLQYLAYIYVLPPPQRSTKINAIRDILGYFHPHSSDHDDSDRWWTCEDMYISWFHSDVSDGSVKQ